MMASETLLQENNVPQNQTLDEFLQINNMMILSTLHTTLLI